MSVFLYRDSQTESIDHPGGPDGERYGNHHEDDRKPVDLLQTDLQVLGSLVCYWCKSQPYLGRPGAYLNRSDFWTGNETCLGFSKSF